MGKTDPTGMDTWSLGFSLNGVVIPGVVSGTGSIYVAVDDKGNVGLFVTGGGGGIGGGKLSVGESLSAGVTAGWSNAQDIHGLQGPFASQTVTVGEGASATGEAFEGSYAGKAVVGGSVTIGAGEGASITSGITGTKELMNGKSPEALRPPSMSLPKGTPGKPSNSPAPRVAHPQQVSQAHSTPGFLTRGQNPNQSHMCTGSNIPTKGPCS